MIEHDLSPDHQSVYLVGVDLAQGPDRSVVRKVPTPAREGPIDFIKLVVRVDSHLTPQEVNVLGFMGHWPAGRNYVTTFRKDPESGTWKESRVALMEVNDLLSNGSPVQAQGKLMAALWPALEDVWGSNCCIL